MTIKFRCEHCRKTVNAPDSAAGQRGKCPYCGNTSYIPLPESDVDEIPLAPIDDKEERERQAKVQSLLHHDPAIMEEPDAATPHVPLEHKEDLTSEDLHHYVVNYCMDMFKGNLDRARRHAQQLKNFRHTAIAAVEDFEAGRNVEQTLDLIPRKVLQGFLKGLKDELKA